MIDMTESEALSRAEAYCSASEHCKAEISDKLARWGLPYDAVVRVLEHLEQDKFIDEERFCRAFVNDKYRFAKWGKLKIAQAFQLKKIPSDMAWRFLNEIDEDRYLSILHGLLVGKRKSIRAKSEYELNGKLMRFALSRGFEMKDIRRCIQVSDENECFE